MGFFYPAWKKVIRIGITNPPTITGYQVKVDIIWQPGMKDDFSDLRFSDYYRTLPYWIEESSVVARTSCTVWVKLTEINSTANEFFGYYDNGAASSESSISNTFIFGDDFNRSDSATVGNNWTETNDIYSISNNTLISTPTGVSANFRCWHATTFNGKMMVEARMKRNTAVQTSLCVYGWASTASKEFAVGLNQSTQLTYLRSTGWVGTGVGSADTYYIMGMMIDNTALTANYYVNRTTTLAIDQLPYANTVYTNTIHFEPYWVSGAPTGTVDWVIVRLWQTTEPTCTPTTYGINTAFYQAYIVVLKVIGIPFVTLTAVQHLTHIDLSWVEE